MNKQRFIFDFKPSKRHFDDNGFLIIENNPIAKSGIFEYFLSEIDPELVTNGKEDKIVKVYRPFEELVKAKDGFKNLAITLEHQWVDKEETPELVGSVGTTIKESEPYLIADMLTIYNKKAIEAIEKNINSELSPGYTCDFQCVFVKEAGDIEGEAYDYKQTDISFNHLALVDNGRSGKDLRILDEQKNKEKKGDFMKKNSFTERLKKITKKIVKDEEIDKRDLIREVLALASKPDSDFDGGENEKFDTILKLAEKIAYNKTEDEEVDKRDLIRQIEAISNSNDFKNEDEKFDTILKLLEKLAYDKDERGINDEDVEDEEDTKEVKKEEKEIVKIKDDISELKKTFSEFVKAFQVFLDEEAKEPEHKEEVDVDVEDEEEIEKEKEVIKKQIKDELRKEQKNILNAYNKVRPFVGEFNYQDYSEKEIYDYALKIINPDCRVSDSKSAFLSIASLSKPKVTDSYKSDDDKIILNMLSHIK